MLEGRPLIQALGSHLDTHVALLMDSAYQDNATRELALNLGLQPAVPLDPGHRQQWEYDKRQYPKRNQIERRFGRL